MREDDDTAINNHFFSVQFVAIIHFFSRCLVLAGASDAQRLYNQFPKRPTHNRVCFVHLWEDSSGGRGARYPVSLCINLGVETDSIASCPAGAHDDRRGCCSSA